MEFVIIIIYSINCIATFEKMEGFSSVTPVTGLNRPNSGKEDDDDDDSIAVGGRLYII
jgi:hypothetical protein